MRIKSIHVHDTWYVKEKLDRPIFFLYNQIKWYSVRNVLTMQMCLNWLIFISMIIHFFSLYIFNLFLQSWQHKTQSTTPWSQASHNCLPKPFLQNCLKQDIHLIICSSIEIALSLWSYLVCLTSLCLLNDNIKCQMCFPTNFNLHDL